MLLVKAVLALATAHVLPGALVVAGLRLGRDRWERWVLSAALGGLVASGIYFIALILPSPGLYPVLLGAIDLAAPVILWRRRRLFTRGAVGPRLATLAALGVLIVALEAAYLVTTGTLFRPDVEGNLVMDRALQRDTLFHVGMVRALEVGYPPELLSVSGVHVSYHVGYHLQVAAWARYFGIDALDGVYRIGMMWWIALLVLTVFMLGRRFGRRDGFGLAGAALAFGSGLGFLFLGSASTDWASLVFMDALLVSVLLVNPLLPALVLLAAGVALLHDFLESGEVGALIGSIACLSALFVFKVFLGAQVLAAVLVAALWCRGAAKARLRGSALALMLASLPFLVTMHLATRESNTAVSVRPLEIVRYSMEKVEWTKAIGALSRVGDLEGSLNDVAVAGLAAVFWVVGFLGLRLTAAPGMARDLVAREATVRLPLAFMVCIGLAVALVFRVAPEEATGTSRLEAQNDVLWFATQAGWVLWLWTAEALWVIARRGGGWKLVSWTAAVWLAFPGTVQHFLFKGSLPPDRVSAALVNAVRRVEESTPPGQVWVDPPVRVRPSLIAYLAGRPVVYDGYVGYDYMFVPRDEIEWRRHAVAQFWRTPDPAFAAWFLERFAVRGVLATDAVPPPAGASSLLETAWSQDGVHVFRVTTGAVPSKKLVAPGALPLGVRGVGYFGEGWGAPEGSPRTRALLPGRAILYVPVEEKVPFTLTLELAVPHGPGEILFEGESRPVAAEDRRIRLEGRSDARGLVEIGIEWRGVEALIVRHVRLTVD